MPDPARARTPLPEAPELLAEQRRPLRRGALVLLGSIALACVGPRVEYEFDPGADFSRYTRFAWIDPELLSEPPALARSPIVDKRIRLTIEQALMEKRYRRAAEDDATFLLMYQVAGEEKIERRPIYGPVTGAEVGHQLIPYLEGTLVIEVFDGKSKELVWRGWVTEVFDDRYQAVESLSKLVERLLDAFPPPPQS